MDPDGRNQVQLTFNADVEARPDWSPHGAVSGTVLQADGVTPVPGTAVEIVDAVTGTPIVLDAPIVTGADGTYSVLTVLPGLYTAVASPPADSELAVEWYLNENSFDAANAFQVLSGSATVDISFTLSSVIFTPAGATSTVDDPGSGVTLDFTDVTAGGQTTINADDEPPAGTETGAFEFAGTFYEIETTATFTGLVKLSIVYVEADLPEGVEEADLRLFHWDGTAWIDVTLLPVDTELNIIMGEVASLSPFVLALPPTTTVEFLPPLSTTEDFALQDGSTLPVKFRLFDGNGAEITDSSPVLLIEGSSGCVVCGVDVAYDTDAQAYKINVKTSDWELDSYTVTVVVDKVAVGNQGLDLVQKGVARGRR